MTGRSAGSISCIIDKLIESALYTLRIAAKVKNECVKVERKISVKSEVSC
jgi:hypothetical protein